MSAKQVRVRIELVDEGAIVTDGQGVYAFQPPCPDLAGALEAMRQRFPHLPVEDGRPTPDPCGVCGGPAPVSPEDSSHDSCFEGSQDAQPEASAGGVFRCECGAQAVSFEDLEAHYLGEHLGINRVGLRGVAA